MQSVRKFDYSQLRHNVPKAPPPPPLPSPTDTPTLQMDLVSVSNNSPPRAKNVHYTEEDTKPSYTNFVTTGSPYLRLVSHPGSNATNVHKESVKTSTSLPAGDGNGLGKSRDAVPPPPPLPHLPIKRQPSALLREIRGESKKRWSGHNLGMYSRLRHVETVEKRAFPIGRVVGHPMHVITTQDLIRSFHKGVLNRIPFREPLPSHPVGKIVQSPAVHVPKMKAKFSPTKKLPIVGFSKKRVPGKLKKSVATDPEDELPRIPTPPPLDKLPVPATTKQQKPSKKSTPRLRLKS